MTIHVHVERLVLDGFELGSRDAGLLRDALGAELVRLLEESGPAGELASGGAVRALRAPSVALHAGATPAAIGTQVAGAVHGSFAS